MRVPSRLREHGLRFDITPLIDVVFQLIIFFLVATRLVRNESLEDVELPVATQQDREDETARRLVVTVTDDSKLHVGAQVVPLQEVEQLILAGKLKSKGGDYEVRIRTDRSVPYGDIEPLLLACAKAGVTNVKWAVLRK